MDKKEITDIKGNTKMLGCLGCAIQNGEVENPGGSIATSNYFDANQDYEIPIPGFIIIASKRHIKSIDEFTNEERQDFINFLTNVRRGIRKSLNVQVVYLVQEEDTVHHFHVWIFPRYDWMEKQFGLKVQSLRPIMEYARKNLKTKENLKQVDNAIENLKKYFKEQSSS